MSSFVRAGQKRISSKKKFIDPDEELPDISEAEAVLLDLASVFADTGAGIADSRDYFNKAEAEPTADTHAPNLEAKYRALLEQIPIQMVLNEEAPLIGAMSQAMQAAGMHIA